MNASTKSFDLLCLGVGAVSLLVLAYICSWSVAPYYSFHGLYRIGVDVAILANTSLLFILSVRTVDWKRLRFSVRRLLVITTAVALGLATFTAMEQHTLMKLGFFCSKARLEDAVRTKATDQDYGLYHVGAIREENNLVILVTSVSEDGWDPAGFVYVADSEQPITPDDLPFMYSGLYELGNGWYAFYSLYKWAKVGWS